jgi:predicted  nucleic acid-binding Zn-ribbon protein
MLEPRKEPTLDELLEKVERLETQIVDIREALKLESTNTTEHINSVYKYLAEIHDLLWPLVHKAFPGFAETWKQWDSILKNKKNPSSKDRA